MQEKLPPVPLGAPGRALEAIGGAMILAMMAVTAIDVAGRYFLGRPIGGAFEITEILMGLVIFAGMPIATARRAHIAIDLFDTALSWRMRCWQAVIGDAICAVIAAVLAWRIWARAQSLLAVGETTMQLGVPRGLVAWGMSALMASAALVFLLASGLALRAALSGRRA